MATSMTMPYARSGMNIALWTLQVLSGIFWSVTGFGRVLCLNLAVWNQSYLECLGFPQCRRLCSSSSGFANSLAGSA